MAKVKQGNTLSSPVLQAGYTIENDGYGLLTCKATYKVDKASAANAIKRGDVFSADARLRCHKASVSYGSLEVATITADYCGIAAGDWTDPNVTGTDSLSTEPITSHPNFFSSKDGRFKICGDPPFAVATSIQALKPYSDQGGIYEGENGAIFENAGSSSVSPGKFLGFYSKASDTAKKLYQRTSYLAPTSAFTGIIYTTKADNVQKLRGYIGKTMSARAPQGFRYLLPAYFGDTFSAKDETDQLMIANVHFEDYGVLYKLSYEIRFNAEGYVRQVYQGTNV